MTLKEFLYKVKYKLECKLITNNWDRIDYKKYCGKYSSYRHMRKKYTSINNGEINTSNKNLYMTARPNPRAGIGHQLANWIAGYWFAEYFGLKFAHIPFSSVEKPFYPNKWDDFMGFGEQEELFEDLLKKGWKCVYLPLFDEENHEHIEIIRKIISSYSGEKAIFCLEQDQFFKDQYKIQDELKTKFYKRHRKPELIYSEEYCNIAVHIRRGDIVQTGDMNNANLTMRWIENDYFENAVYNVQKFLNSQKKTRVYVFSQGEESDFPEFQKMQNVIFCLKMGAMESFLHMVYADVLITSKSSFSYKPALLNSGIKFCPDNFWHGYPVDDESWYILDSKGNIK